MGGRAGMVVTSIQFLMLHYEKHEVYSVDKRFLGEKKEDEEKKEHNPLSKHKCFKKASGVQGKEMLHLTMEIMAGVLGKKEYEMGHQK